MGFAEYTFFSPALHQETTVTVTTPDAPMALLREGLDKVYEPNLRFPTIYLLPGAGGSSSEWHRKTQIELFASESRKRFITVSIDGGTSFYTDMRHGQNWFTFLTAELPAYIRQTFPSSAKREDNFIMGFSMGGYGAMKAALSCPENYAYAVAVGGAADITEMLETLGGDSDLIDRVIPNAFGSLEAYKGSDNDLCRLAKMRAKDKRPLPKLVIACGAADPTLKPCLHFSELLSALGIENTFYTADGAHDYAFVNHVFEIAVKNWFNIRTPESK